MSSSIDIQNSSSTTSTTASLTSPSLQTLTEQIPQATENALAAAVAPEGGAQKKKRIKKKHTGENALKKFFPDNLLKLHKTQGVIFTVRTLPFHLFFIAHHIFFLSFFF